MSTKTDNTPAVVPGATPVLTDAAVISMLPADDEWADVDSGDMTDDGVGRIPYMKLNRKLDGGFVHPDTGEIGDTLEFIWLAKGKSRAQWDKPFNPKEVVQPDCRSFDGITPDPTSPNKKAEVCANCPFSQWGYGDNAGQETYARCHATVEAMVFLPDPLGAGRLARLRFGGMAATKAKAFWDSFFTRLPTRPPIAYLSRAVLEPTDTDNGKFLVPRFERIEEIPRSAAQPLIAERDRRLADWKADISEAVIRGDEAETPTASGTPEGTYVDPSWDAASEPF